MSMDGTSHFGHYIVKIWNKIKGWTPGATAVDVSEIRARVLDHEYVIDTCDSTSGWNSMGAIGGLATTTNHVRGDSALTFNKVAGGLSAWITKDVTNFDASEYLDHYLLGCVMYVSSVANINYAFIRVGTNAANYSEWRINDEDIVAGRWNSVKLSLTDQHAAVVGQGLKLSLVSWVAFGVTFDANANTLADIRVDHLAFHSNRHTTAQLNAEISTEISSPNINVSRIGDTAVDANAGNVSDGTQRTTLADDDPAVTALEIIDDWDATHDSGHADDGPQLMVDYNATPAAGDDGDAVRMQSDAYGHIEPAAYHRALGANQVVEIAPVKYDVLSGTARADAALAAAGAFDAAPTEIPTGGRQFMELWYGYTRGGAAGSFRTRIEKAVTISGADSWGRDGVVDTAAFAAGSDSNSEFQREDWLYTATGASEEIVILQADLGRADKVRVPCAEVGNVGAPGDLWIYFILYNL